MRTLEQAKQQTTTSQASSPSATTNGSKPEKKSLKGNATARWLRGKKMVEKAMRECFADNPKIIAGGNDYRALIWEQICELEESSSITGIE